MIRPNTESVTPHTRQEVYAQSLGSPKEKTIKTTSVGSAMARLRPRMLEVGEDGNTWTGLLCNNN
jgi:hypothetical protein